MSEFVDSPMSPEFIKTPAGYKGSPKNTYNGDDCPPFSQYRRTPSPNGVPEVINDGVIGKPSGESDHMPETYHDERQSDIDQGR